MVERIRSQGLPEKGAPRPQYRPEEPYRLYIGGEWVTAPRILDAVDPCVGEPWAEIPRADGKHVDMAVAAARAAFRDWRQTTPAVRQEALWRIADRIEADPDRWAGLLATENGRPIREAYFTDIPTCTATLRFFSGLVRDLNGDHVPVDDPLSLVYTVREPLGVVAALISWNSPLVTLVDKIAPALAAGNTIVVKPSEYASASVLEFVRAIEDLLPPGVLNVVTGSGEEAGSALVSHPDIAKISFTGRTDTGRRVLTAAGRTLTPSLMKLGGKGTMIVYPDADLEAAVADAATGIYMANGESSIAASRLLVHEDVREEFIERFAATAEAVVLGDALDLATEMGPLVSRKHRERVLDAVRRAVSEGAEPVTGGDPPELPPPLDGGFYFRPTLLSDAGGSTIASREELLGPVTVIESFRDEWEAVERANATRYGMAAGVWTRDLTRAHRVARELHSGIVWVNKWFDLPVGAPKGGTKDSGFGRELTAETLLEYSTAKVVNVDLGSRRPALWGAGTPENHLEISADGSVPPFP